MGMMGSSPTSIERRSRRLTHGGTATRGVVDGPYPEEQGYFVPSGPAQGQAGQAEARAPDAVVGRRRRWRPRIRCRKDWRGEHWLVRLCPHQSISRSSFISCCSRSDGNLGDLRGMQPMTRTRCLSASDPDVKWQRIRRCVARRGFTVMANLGRSASLQHRLPIRREEHAHEQDHRPALGGGRVRVHYADERAWTSGL